jgi:hypothetical protein
MRREEDARVWQDGGVSDDQPGYPGAPPGWYPDPAGGPGQRWWDGYTWNEAVVTPAQAPPPPWTEASARMTSASTSHLLRGEQGMVNLARVAVAIPAVHYIVDFIIQQANAAQYLSIGNQFRTDWHDIQNNIPTPTIHESTSLGWLSGLTTLVTLVAVIVACVWQHRAASAARALGLPATHSPGWGVGCWFVPFVNLFMPYQAIRDCLPAGHPGRRLVLGWWLLLMGCWTTSLAAEIGAFFSRPVALGFGVPAMIFSLGLLATAPRIVSAISESHQVLAGQANVPSAVS